MPVLVAPVATHTPFPYATSDNCTLTAPAEVSSSVQLIPSVLVITNDGRLLAMK